MSDQAEPVRVKTNGDDFASLECGRVLVEFTKDSDIAEALRIIKNAIGKEQ